MFVGAEGRKRRQPLARGVAPVTRPLLGLGPVANAPLDCRVLDDDEMPGLLVRAARRRPRRQQTLLDDVARHGIGGKAGYGPAPIHALIKRPSIGVHLLLRPSIEHMRDESWGRRWIMLWHRLIPIGGAFVAPESPRQVTAHRSEGKAANDHV